MKECVNLEVVVVLPFVSNSPVDGSVCMDSSHCVLCKSFQFE